MKKLLLLSTCYLSFFNYNLQAMDKLAPEDAPKAPITTGFFDRTLSDTTIELLHNLRD